MRLLILLLLAMPSWGAWGWYILHEPAGSQVSGGPHTNFVVWVDITHNDLRTTANGGLVTDTQGDDIAPFSDATCTTQLEFDREIYNASTGRWGANIKVPSLSSTTDVYICFENSAQTAYLGSAANTWTAYVARYGFGAGTTISAADSTGNGHTLTNSGAAADTDAQLYGSALFTSSESDCMTRSAAAITAAPLTITAWVKSATSATQNILAYQESDTVEDVLRSLLYLDKVQTQVQQGGGGSGLAAASVNYSTADWFHAASVLTSATSRDAYYNGGSAGSNTTSSTPAGIGQTKVGCAGAGTNYMNGRIDEIRTRNVASSSDWILTEKNSGIYSTFWTVGSPTALTGATPRRRVVVIQ